MQHRHSRPPSTPINSNSWRRSSPATQGTNEKAKLRRTYLGAKLTIDDLKQTPAEPLTRGWARFDPADTRIRLLAKGGFDTSKIVPFLVGPLDIQWAYVDATRQLWNEPRAKSLLPQAVSGARFLLARNWAPRLDDGAPLLPASCLGEDHSLHKDAYFIPFLTQPHDTAIGLFDPLPPKPNYSATSADYLAALGLNEAHQSYAGVLWWHALAIAYAPSYVTENSGGIATDWPRIPLPASLDILLSSAELGKLLADVLDPLRPVHSGLLIPSVGPVRRVDDGAIRPELGHLEVRTGWGHVQKDGAVMPARAS